MRLSEGTKRPHAATGGLRGWLASDDSSSLALITLWPSKGIFSGPAASSRLRLFEAEVIPTPTPDDAGDAKHRR